MAHLIYIVYLLKMVILQFAVLVHQRVFGLISWDRTFPLLNAIFLRQQRVWCSHGRCAAGSVEPVEPCVFTAGCFSRDQHGDQWMPMR
jgi:hypothetical protein